MERNKNHDCEHCKLKKSCDEWNEVFKTDVCFDVEKEVKESELKGHTVI